MQTSRKPWSRSSEQEVGHYYPCWEESVAASPQQDTDSGSSAVSMLRRCHWSIRKCGCAVLLFMFIKEDFLLTRGDQANLASYKVGCQSLETLMGAFVVCRHSKEKQPERTKQRASSMQGTYGIKFACDVNVTEAPVPQSWTDTCMPFEKADTQEASSNRENSDAW